MKAHKKPTGAEAVAILKKQVSNAGVKKKAARDLKAIKNKYPGLYK